MLVSQVIFWHFNRPWNPKTWKVLCSWVRTQTNNKQTKTSTALSWIFCFLVAQMAFRLLWSPTEVNFGVSGITPLHGNFCSHGNILCASACAVEDAIHHLQANMSQARQTPQALVVILNSDILWVPSRNKLFIQPCFSWLWNRGWKGFGPQSTQDNAWETSSGESSTCYSATPWLLAFAGVDLLFLLFLLFSLCFEGEGCRNWCLMHV